MTKDDHLTQIGLQIRSIRKSKNLTQDEVAFMANLARSYYGDVERGERNIAALNLIKIANSLDVKVGELFLNVKDH